MRQLIAGLGDVLVEVRTAPDGASVEIDLRSNDSAFRLLGSASFAPEQGELLASSLSEAVRVLKGRGASAPARHAQKLH